MKIIIAPYSGFCFGVKRAISEGEKTANKDQDSLASLGPLIHNPQEIKRLEKKGIIPRESIHDINESRVLIRTHGISPEIYKELGEKEVELIDCTCPYVRKVQKIANEYALKEYTILILGNEEHPEVQGILGWSLKKGIAFPSLSNIIEKNLPEQKICLVSQTTENTDTFNQVANYLKDTYAEVIVYNTICSATLERQKSAIDLAQKVDLMIVVGGLNSANTQKLTDLCLKAGVITKHIETAKEIKSSWFDDVNIVGVTAGASTPDWIIEEVVRTMEEIKVDSEEQATQEEIMQDDLEQDMAQIGEVKPGDTLTGKIVQINDDEILVDVGGKSDGIIPSNELSYRNIDPHSLVKVGDEIKVVVLSVENAEGNMILSKRKAEQEQALAILEKAFQEGSIVEAEAIEVVKGGILVDVGLRGFVPASLIERGYVENLEQFIGQKLQFKVIEFDSQEQKAVLSRKAILDEEYEKNKEKIWDELKEGQTRKGTVQRITDFGAFIDLGGVDGLLHVSEMGWGRVSHPKDIVTVGTEIDVYIVGLDKEKSRISLGLKQLSPSPWQIAAEKYLPGSTIQGKVVRIAPFGAFVEIEPGIDGLVHISQLSWERVEKPEDVISVGQEVEAKVLDVDVEKKRMSLSLKETTDRPVMEKKESKPELSYSSSEPNEPSGVTLGDIFGDLFKDMQNK